jgi:hypothetical protein
MSLSETSMEPRSIIREHAASSNWLREVSFSVVFVASAKRQKPSIRHSRHGSPFSRIINVDRTSDAWTMLTSQELPVSLNRLTISLAKCRHVWLELRRWHIQAES